MSDGGAAVIRDAGRPSNDADVVAPDAGADAAPERCPPNSLKACVTADGVSGAQSCRSDGAGYWPCFPAPPCADARLDGSETDVDCGGPECAPCGLGRVCRLDSDCATERCANGACAELTMTCTDGAKNGTETDTDCGGTHCPPCAVGKACLMQLDCSTRSCMEGVCAQDQCANGVRDADESDVDCGGMGCVACADGKRCNSYADCRSGPS